MEKIVLKRFGIILCAELIISFIFSYILHAYSYDFSLSEKYLIFLMCNSLYIGFIVITCRRMFVHSKDPYEYLDANTLAYIMLIALNMIAVVACCFCGLGDVGHDIYKWLFIPYGGVAQTNVQILALTIIMHIIVYASIYFAPYDILMK